MLRKATLAVVTLTLALYTTAHAEPPSNSRTPTPPAVTTPCPSVTGKATLDYYNKAKDLLQQEVLPALLQALQNGDMNTAAAICRRAASNLRALPGQQVDSELLNFAAEVVAWLNDFAAYCEAPNGDMFPRLHSRLSDLERRRHELESRLERRYELRLK
jgi:hypothetical protein